MEVNVTSADDCKNTADKEAADTVLGNAANGEKKLYYDFALSKTVTTGNSNPTTSITETKPVTITLVLPDGMQDGKYKVVRVHDGKPDTLNVSDDGKTVMFTSDKFSTFVLDYTPKTDEIVQPSTADNGGTQPTAADKQDNGETQPTAADKQDNGETQPTAADKQDNGGTQPTAENKPNNSGTQQAAENKPNNSGTQPTAENKPDNSGSQQNAENQQNNTSTYVAQGKNTVEYNSQSTSAVSSIGNAVAEQTVLTTNGKDLEPATGDIRESSALMFANFGMAAAILYLLSILVETLSRRKRRSR
jgi:hypothetical protein